MPFSRTPGTASASALRTSDASRLPNPSIVHNACTRPCGEAVSVNSHATSGTTSTNFTFSTVYTGPDPATQVDVVVNGTSHPLSLVSGNPTSGATYSATLTLPAGTHDYAFYATDGTNDWSDPPTPGVYSGLAVSVKGAALRVSKIRAPRADNAPYAYDPG